MDIKVTRADKLSEDKRIEYERINNLINKKIQDIECKSNNFHELKRINILQHKYKKYCIDKELIGDRIYDQNIDSINCFIVKCALRTILE